MLTLRSDPFNLTLGMLVAAKVSARNSYGWSSDSQVNVIGATIQTEPSQMNTPVYVAASSSASQIEVTWLPLTTNTDTGGVTIDSYNLQYSVGSNTTYTDI